MPTDERAFLDRPAARVIAALVILLCGALLAYIHRDDLAGAGDSVSDLPASEGGSADPAAPCIEQRFAEIDGMIDDGIVDEGQAELFKQRALAMCRSTTGDGGGQGPSLPME